jgi:lipopolysaccharide transport system permease protein
MNNQENNTTDWLFEITPKKNSSLTQEVWQFADAFREERRGDGTQTVLGPLWYLIQPLFTSLLIIFLIIWLE